jgi:hypothetical protein
MSNHKRLLEWGKTLLIFFLSISAVALLLRSHLYSVSASSSGSNFILSFLGFGSDEESTAATSSTALQCLFPIQIVFNNNGAQYGLQYQQDEVTSQFDSVATLFSESAGALSSPISVSEDTFRNSLQNSGIYLEFPAPVPISILEAWLTGGSFSTDSEHTASQIELSLDSAQNAVILYYRNSTDGLFYQTVTDVSFDRLKTVLSSYQSNGCSFAFQDTSYTKLSPYTLIGQTASSLDVYSTANPIPLSSVSKLLSDLAFLNYSESPVDNGVAIIEYSDSLSVSSDGTISYNSDDDRSNRFPGCDNLWNAINTIQQSVLKYTLQSWRGDAEVYLSKVENSGTSIVLTYDYCINGVYVRRTNIPYAAQFTVSNGYITNFMLYPCSFTKTNDTSPVLPQLQATAALEALVTDQRPLSLCYQSHDATVQASWISGS